MAATVFGTVADLLSHLLGGNAKHATPIVAGVECPDGNVRATQGTNDGKQNVHVGSFEPGISLGVALDATLLAKEAKQPSKADSALSTLVNAAALPAAGAFTTTDYVAIPSGARRVSFIVSYTKHASATTGQWKARMLWKWSDTVTGVAEPFVDANSQTIVEPKVALKSYCQDIAGPKYDGTTTSGLVQLTFEVPAGVVGGILQLAEMGDTTNKGTVSLYAATSEVL